ncbi:F-box protein At-B [Dorcoceras hygrometricum]|uniref:F-box protein At-B n=1 Tax=Dorcoceras hygrometricum TaxID=472368 RepID=A0A2Z7DAA6_9LAMI|nr:F-box protein At-B [Dorcoceras hygrometricum]
MDNHGKRPRAETAAVDLKSGGCEPQQEGMPLPETLILNEIFPKLNLESLCSLACVCRTLTSMVSRALSTIAFLDFSAFSPNGDILGHIGSRIRGMTSLTIDCLRLDDSSVINMLGENIQELNLLKCASLSFDVISSIGGRCPDLRILVLELAEGISPEIFGEKLADILKRFNSLEHLTIKVRRTIVDADDLGFIDPILPKTLKCLKLEPVSEQDSFQFIQEIRDEKRIPRNLVNPSGPDFKLQCLALVLDVISDRLVASITSSFPLLVDLNLEDRPCMEPILPHDLTNRGLQFLCSCEYLTCLSIIRSKVVPFKRINDLGILLLSESCGGLESVRLGGFSTVTDAGFSSLLNSCKNLKKFEVRHAPLLSDLAFHEINGPLVELKLVSCNLITSEAVAELSSSSTLEVLDTNGCRSIADPCLDYISFLRTLTSLNLGGADITDRGLRILGEGDLPIVSLRLRGCTRVTDRGIIFLLCIGNRVKRTLSLLDVGHMPGISDRGIQAIASSAESLTELCMRYCFHVTDTSIKILASRRCDGPNMLQRLDVCQCIRLTAGIVEFLKKKPLFRGLRWLGVGRTSLSNRTDDFGMICRMRPWLTVCFGGCEVGCHDGWQFHSM